MTKPEILEVMIMIREAEDSLVEIRKALAPFDESNNWNGKYTDEQGRIDTFRYLDLDPRIIARHGITKLDKIADKLRDYWYKLRELNLQ